MTVRTSIGGLVVLIVSLSTWNLVQARSLVGQCSNWMVGSLTEISGTNRKADIKAVCISIRESGDFIAEYEPRSQSCMLCSHDDWTPSSSSSSPSSPIASDNNPDIAGKGRSHPCGDSSIPVSAEWTYYGRGGGGTWSDREKAGLICKGLGYATYSSSEMKHFACDKGYVNCQLKKTVPIDNVVQKDKKTIYKYGRNSAHRMPTH